MVRCSIAMCNCASTDTENSCTVASGKRDVYGMKCNGAQKNTLYIPPPSQSVAKRQPKGGSSHHAQSLTSQASPIKLQPHQAVTRIDTNALAFTAGLLFTMTPEYCILASEQPRRKAPPKGRCQCDSASQRMVDAQKCACAIGSELVRAACELSDLVGGDCSYSSARIRRGCLRKRLRFCRPVSMSDSHAFAFRCNR